MKLLLDVIDDIRSLADSLQAFADSMQASDSEDTTPYDSPALQVPSAPVITIDQVRAVLAEKSGEGKTTQVKALLYKFGANKLSAVNPEHYAALMEEAKKL